MIGHIKIWMLLLLTLPLTGCFEIIHELDVNTDGSGHFGFVLNLSRSKSKIEMLLLLDEVNGHKIPSLEEVDQKFASFIDSAKVSKGITGVRGNFNQEQLILEFDCNFDKVSRINTRIYEVWKQLDSSEAVYENYYSYNGQQFMQNFKNRVTVLFKKMSAADREVLVGAEYTSILRFENEVDLQSNKAAKISSNRKVVFLKSPILNLVQEPVLFNNNIKIKS